MPSLRRNHSSIKYNQNKVSEEKLRIAAWSGRGRTGDELLASWRLHGLVTLNPFTIYTLETWTLLTQWQKSFFAVIGLTNKPCFKFRSPYIPWSAFECSGCKGSLEEPSVFLASRSFDRTGQLLIPKQPILLDNKVSNHDGWRSKQSLAERQRKIENNIIYHIKLKSVGTYNYGAN